MIYKYLYALLPFILLFNQGQAQTQELTIILSLRSASDDLSVSNLVVYIQALPQFSTRTNADGRAILKVPKSEIRDDIYSLRMVVRPDKQPIYLHDISINLDLDTIRTLITLPFYPDKSSNLTDNTQQEDIIIEGRLIDKDTGKPITDALVLFPSSTTLFVNELGRFRMVITPMMVKDSLIEFNILTRRGPIPRRFFFDLKLGNEQDIMIDEAEVIFPLPPSELNGLEGKPSSRAMTIDSLNFFVSVLDSLRVEFNGLVSKGNGIQRNLESLLTKIGNTKKSLISLQRRQPVMDDESIYYLNELSEYLNDIENKVNNQLSRINTTTQYIRYTTLFIIFFIPILSGLFIIYRRWRYMVNKPIITLYWAVAGIYLLSILPISFFVVEANNADFEKYIRITAIFLVTLLYLIPGFILFYNRRHQLYSIEVILYWLISLAHISFILNFFIDTARTFTFILIDLITGSFLLYWWRARKIVRGLGLSQRSIQFNWGGLDLPWQKYLIWAFIFVGIAFVLYLFDIQSLIDWAKSFFYFFFGSLSRSVITVIILFFILILVVVSFIISFSDEVEDDYPFYEGIEESMSNAAYVKQESYITKTVETKREKKLDRIVTEFTLIDLNRIISINTVRNYSQYKHVIYWDVDMVNTKKSNWIRRSFKDFKEALSSIDLIQINRQSMINKSQIKKIDLESRVVYLTNNQAIEIGGSIYLKKLQDLKTKRPELIDREKEIKRSKIATELESINLNNLLYIAVSDHNSQYKDITYCEEDTHDIKTITLIRGNFKDFKEALSSIDLIQINRQSMINKSQIKKIDLGLRKIYLTHGKERDIGAAYLEKLLDLKEQRPELFE